MTLPRRTKLRPRSAKTAKHYRDVRGPLVAAFLEEHPWCQIRWDERCTGRAVDVDERRLRSQGGSTTDPDNLQAACRYCHDQKHAFPSEARRRGFTLHAGDAR